MPAQSEASIADPAKSTTDPIKASPATLSVAEEERVLQLAAEIAEIGKPLAIPLFKDPSTMTSASLRQSQLLSIIMAATATTSIIAADNDRQPIMQQRERPKRETR
ncbi:hypothetical protein CORC01_06623 [Colletotrichum orchidophilum]|uniref:Uncharacterized protein n=1 Tax=Colletotrichum orchidophilum TaxID=1209926 RepID=A0A1G4B9P0_9PEZI|nr:uncharacterized protein CORC01_06623 [Colletotrichum orchidophilum]OHE98109.1 hypothetical protein CORC01_06623 [Colletotrichum orchidophilum]